MLPDVPNPRVTRLKRRAIQIGLLGMLALVLTLAYKPLLVGYARWFRVDDPVPADVIVLLLGGTDHRALKAAELYKRGLAPVICMATAKTHGQVEYDENAITRKILIGAGVPEKAIYAFPEVATSTREEAEATLAYVRAHPSVHKILVVTTAFHTARSGWVFRKTLAGTGVEIHTAAADHPDFNESNWYTMDESLLVYFNETLKTLYYWISY
ncbi:YdcF family protein [Singulisphaera rosea]